LALTALSFALAFLALTELTNFVARLLIGGCIGATLYALLSYWLNREWMIAATELVDARNLNGVKFSIEPRKTR
jgi:hypothetical protein